MARINNDMRNLLIQRVSCVEQIVECLQWVGNLQ